MPDPGPSDPIGAEVQRLAAGAPVHVEFQDGVATLTGEVPDAARRREIEQALLQRVEVLDVRNFLRIAPPPGDLPHRVEDLLQREGVRIEGLAVEAADGAVTLYGEAAGWFDRDAAERLAWTLPGVQAVSNRIRLLPGAVEPEGQQTPP